VLNISPFAVGDGIVENVSGLAFLPRGGLTILIKNEIEFEQQFLFDF
jgi:hypothetical protein